MKILIFLSILLIFSHVHLDKEEQGSDSVAEFQFEPTKYYGRKFNRHTCDIIPEYVKIMIITPAILVNVTFHSVLNCISSSVIKRLTYGAIYESPVTCNGITVGSTNFTYYENFFQGYDSSVKLNLINYTMVGTAKNGNSNYMECGIIDGGYCHGDVLSGTVIYLAEDQEGCSTRGIEQIIAIRKENQIQGRCQSICSLGSSIIVSSVPINNWGYILKTDEQIDQIN